MTENNKENILFFSSRIPGKNSKRLDDFFKLIYEIKKNLEVYCILQQSLFADGETIEELKKAGVNFISFKKRNISRPYKIQLKNIFQKYKFNYIFFDSVYSVKHYLYYIEKFSPSSKLIIDIRRSQFLMEMKFIEPKNKYGKISYIRDKEIPVFSYFDAIIISDKKQAEHIGEELPEAEKIILNKGNVVGSLKKITAKKREYSERDITIKSYDLGESSIKRVNSILKNVDKNKKYTLLKPNNSVTPNYFLKRLLFCMESHYKNRVVLPTSNLFFSSHSKEKLPTPDSDWEFNEFLKEHLIGNMAEWRYLDLISEPCFLIKTSLVFEIGLLDESYKSLSYSLLDYGYKAYQNGFRIIRNHESFIYIKNPERYAKNYDYSDQRKLIYKWSIKGVSFLESLKPAAVMIGSQKKGRAGEG